MNQRLMDRDNGLMVARGGEGGGEKMNVKTINKAIKKIPKFLLLYQYIILFLMLFSKSHYFQLNFFDSHYICISSFVSCLCISISHFSMDINLYFYRNFAYHICCKYFPQFVICFFTL